MTLFTKLLLVTVLTGTTASDQRHPVMNGFDLRAATIPSSEIHQGGPPRDGIPALSRPAFITADDPAAPQPDDRVLGLALNGDVRAYPVAILNWHELVNDQVGGQPVVISYCPLCGTGMAFSAQAAGRALSFGVSGLLYNSDVLMYDHQSGSLWSQILATAISGALHGTRLRPLMLEHTRWQDWLQRHPDSRVMSPETGFQRDYQRNPYLGYGDRPGLYFPVSNRDQRYPDKSWVLGIEVGGKFRGYPFSELRQAGGEVKESVAGHRLRVVHNGRNRSARAWLDGEPLPAVTAFWFAWVAFHPHTEVYTAP